MAAALALSGASPALADETAEPPQVELVLDVSGSMRAADIDGATRISVAKTAFGEVVDALPETTNLGIRVLGATYAGDDKKKGCQDTQQIVPVGPVDRVKAKNAIATLRPTGFTPIGLALRAAAKDLETGSAVRRIVLITDGEDTCTPPDPCAVARSLAAQGAGLVVDTLGLTPDEKTRKQLLCISRATGGTFASARSEQDLTDRVRQLVDRAAAPPRVTPAPVTGATGCEQAPRLSPGVYADRERIGEHRFYRVPLAPGQELRVAASIALDRPVSRDFGVLLRAVTPDGRELVRGLDAGSDRADVVSAGLRWSAEPPSGPSSEPSSEPPEAQEVCLVLSNSFASATSVGAPGMPVELIIDTVAASTAPDAPGLGRGFLLLLVLAVAGLIAGVLAGWLTRWWVATWREN